MPNDYISREVLREDILHDSEHPSEVVNYFLGMVDCQHSADVAPVVRCKDCRFYAIKQSSLCDMHNTAVNAEDYCSYGTKMDGGEHHAD